MVKSCTHSGKRLFIFFFLWVIFSLLLCVYAGAEGSITGLAWLDKDINGVNQGESALAQVAVYVEYKDPDGNFSTLMDTVTQKDGLFSFSSLSDGTYRIKAVLPEKHYFTLHGKDSDLLPASGRTSYSPEFTIEGSTDITLRIGACKTPSYITVVAFEDLNANGGRMTSEPAVRGVQAELLYEYENETYIISGASTGKDGTLKFEQLSPADYKIAVHLPEGYTFGPLGEKISQFYNCVPPTEEDVGYSVSLPLEAKSSLGVGIGIVKTGTLSGRIINDNAGAEGISVELFSPEFNLTRTATTDANGEYVFKNLQESQYEITAILPDEWMFASENSLITEQGTHSASAYVSTEKAVELKDIVLVHNTVLTVSVLDPSQDNQPIEGVSVRLAAENETLSTLLTDEKGQVIFSRIPYSALSVECTLPDGYIFSEDAAQALMKDYAALASGSADIAFTPGGESVSLEIDAIRAAVVSGHVFENNAMDGLYHEGDAFLSGFSVAVIREDGSEAGKTTTQTDGSYSFTALLPGNYAIRLYYEDPYIASDKADAAQAAPYKNAIVSQTMQYGETDVFSLSAGETHETDLSVFQAATVEGYVLLNSAYDHLSTNDGGLSGVNVTLLTDTMEEVSAHSNDLTDANGRFYIKGILPGTYILQYAFPEGSLWLNDSYGETSFTSAPFTIQNGDHAQADSLAAAKTVSLSGSVSGIADADAAMTLTLQELPLEYQASADENGDFAFDNLLPGTYRLEATLPEELRFGVQTSDCFAITNSNLAAGEMKLVSGSESKPLVLEAVLPVSLNGTFFWDEDASVSFESSDTPFANLEVVLKAAHYNYSASLSTDEQGQISVQNLLPDSYTLQFALDKDCIVLSEANSSGTQWSLTANVQADEELFISVMRYAQIDGSIWSMDGEKNGLDQIPVSLYKNGTLVLNATTDSNGRYSFRDLYPGTYTLRAELEEGYSFARKQDTQTRNSYIQSGESIAFDVAMGVHYKDMDIGIGAVGSIGDIAWLDMNKNGMQDIGEVGVPYLSFSLLQYDEVIGTYSTDAYGHFEIKDLFPGTYVLQIEVPDGLTTTKQQNEFPLVASILPSFESGTVQTEIVVPSGKMNYNCDLGFALSADGVVPGLFDQVPVKDWTPYSNE